MKPIIYIVCCFISAIGLCKAQGGFTKNYYLDSIYGVCTDAIETPDGKLIVTGINYDPNAGAYILSILGTDSMGIPLWRKNYGNKNLVSLDNITNNRSLVKTNGGFLYYSGVRDSSNNDFSVLIKFDFNADTVWLKRYSTTTGQLYINDVTACIDNGFFLTGWTQNTGNGTNTILIKTDSQGNELWRKIITKPIPNIQEGRCVLQDSVSKRIVIVGYQANGSSGIYEYYNNIIVCDSLGTVQQRHSLPSPCGGLFQDMVQTKDGKFVAVGNIKPCVNVAGYSWSKSFVYKFDIDDLAGGSVWEKQVDSVGLYNYFTTINELPNGNLILSGAIDTTYAINMGLKPMIRLMKLDKNGRTIWRKLYGKGALAENSKRPKSLNLTKDGGFILANELLFANNPKPYTITKIDSTGCDSTVAYCSYKAPQVPEPEQTDFKLFPNPCDGTLFFQLPSALAEDTANITIAINDAMGKQVLKKHLSSLQTELNLAFLAPGLYLFTAYKAEEKIFNSKLMIH